MPRAGLWGALALVTMIAAGPVWAQGAPSVMPVVTLDQERLFTGSRYGQAVQKALDAEVSALAAENRRIESELEAEEKSLTERRAGLSATEFRSLADSFDTKAEETRQSQGAKARALSRRRDELRATFFERAKPILAQLMAERGAVAIIAKDAIVMAFDRIDMTDDAIARLDREMGDGSGPRIQLAPQPDVQPQP